MQVTGLSSVEKSRLSSIFHSSDDGNKGFLDRKDFKVAVVTRFGYKPSKFEVDRIFTEITEKHGKEALTLNGMQINHFLQVMSTKLAAVDQQDVIRQTFLAFDSHCKGFLTMDDFKKAMTKVSPRLADKHKDIESFFREIDRDGDGRVSYKDFEFMMLYDEDGL